LLKTKALKAVEGYSEDCKQKKNDECFDGSNNLCQKVSLADNMILEGNEG